MKSNKKTSMSKFQNKKHRFLAILIIISLILIGIGTYLNLLGNPKRVMAAALTNFTKQIEILTGPTEEETGIQDNYSLTSNLKVNLESETLTLLAPTNPLYQQQLKQLQNINQTDTKIKLVQNKKDKELLFSLESKLNNQNIMNTKYLIQNSTQYYWVEGLVKTYINNGSSNYFESLNSTTTTKENMNYLYDFIIKSLMIHCKTDYFEKNQRLTTYNDTKVKYMKISLKINNQLINKISTNILKDLKKDTRSNKILTSMNPNFSKIKIKDNNKFLKDKEEITINLYTDNLTYQIKKYEIIDSIDQDSNSIIYEKRPTVDYAYYIKNDQIEYQFEIETNKTIKTIKVYTKDKETIGTIILENTSEEKNIGIELNLEKYQLIGNYQAKLSNIKKGKSYDMTHKVSFKIKDPTQMLINANIKINSTITNKNTIQEDVSNSILASSINQTEKANMEQYWATVLTKLKS